MPQHQLDKIHSEGAGKDPNDDLAKREQEALFVRENRQQTHFHRGSLLIFWIIVVVISVGIISLASHYVLPMDYCWISDSQADKLTTILSSLFGGGIIKEYYDKKLGGKKTEKSGN